MKTPETVTLDLPNGDVYTAVRDCSSEPWDISFPEGDSRYFGSVSQVRARMKQIRREVEKTEAEAIKSQETSE
jgi:hypothetical protein